MFAIYNHRKNLGLRTLGFVITISLITLVPLCSYGNVRGGLLFYKNNASQVCYILLKTACAGFRYPNGEINCTNQNQLIANVDTNLSGSNYNCPTIAGNSYLIQSCVNYCNSTIPPVQSMATMSMDCIAQGGYMIGDFCETEGQMGGNPGY